MALTFHYELDGQILLDNPIRAQTYRGATFVLSGENEYSLESPNGFDGTSASRLAVSDTGSLARPSARRRMNSCEMRPSLQVSQ